MIHIYFKMSASKEDPKTMGINSMLLFPRIKSDTPFPF